MRNGICAWRSHARSAVVRVSIGSAIVLLAGAAHAVTLRTVAYTGSVAPETGGATYAGFGPPVLNSAGEVAFTATLQQGGGVDDGNDLGMWSEGSGALALVERQGSPAVGVSGSWDVALSPPVINDAGQVAFRAFTSGPTNIGVWHEGSGVLAPAAVTGEPADGAAVGETYASPFPSGPAFNDAGHVAFHARLAGPGVTSSNDGAVWAGPPGGPLTLAAREGDAATGAGGAAWEGFAGTRLNQSGEIAFFGALDDGGDGIWAGAPSGVALVARDGTAAAGTSGAQFANFIIDPQLDDLGQVAFHAGLEVGVGDATFANDRGIWMGAPGAVARVAREGEVAPNTGGRVFETFSSLTTSGAGEVAFRGFLDSGTGLFIGDGNGIDKIIASGDLAPGTNIALGDATFAGFSGLSINDLGDVAFEAVLSGVAQGVTGDNDETLWRFDRNGNLLLIAREGDVIEYAPGVFGVIDELAFHHEAKVMGRAISDGGALTFGVTFTDGAEAIFVAVPEPGTAGLLLLGLAAVGSRRRRR